MTDDALLEDLVSRVEAELGTPTGNGEARLGVAEVARWILHSDHPDMPENDRERLVEAVVDRLVGGGLTHLDAAGHVRMVDVSEKHASVREALAEAIVGLSDEARARLFQGTLPKGDALASVRIAGIMGAKRTPDLIPLCHPLPLTGVTVDVVEVDSGARITARVATEARTGVEMEAMTAVSVAALALYDMVKSVDRHAWIGPVRLLEKHGGKSGTWMREPET